ncbi:MAG: OmpP1/FadL family transporter [Candidatus Cyclobacteriaceae bacterium M3_2C_046]
MRRVCSLLIFVFVITSNTFGSGYQVLLQGNRQTGLGNVGIGLFPDASSIFFNPGAIGFMDYNQVLLGGNLIFSHNTYLNSEQSQSNYSAQSDNPIGTPFHFFGAWGPNQGNLKLGLGVYTPFGSGVNWGEDWQGEHILRSISLRAIYIQPTVSYKLNQFISLGGGFVYALGQVNLQRSIPVTGLSVDPSVELDGAASGIGYNLGIMIKPTSQLNVGLNYRSKVNMKVENGDAYFNVPQSLNSFFPEQNSFNATLPLPSSLGLGLAYQLNDVLSLHTEVNYVGWKAYDSLTFDFSQNTSRLIDSRSPRNYENSWIFKLGAEYQIAGIYKIRIGGYYDQTPVQAGYMTPETPDADRLGLTFGLGLQLSQNLAMDLSFLYIHGQERKQTLQDAQQAGTINYAIGKQDVLPGTYQLNAFIPGVSVSYKF